MRQQTENFSLTSGALFASHKAPLRVYLAAIAVFMNEVKGKNALALSRDLGMSHKACWVMLHKVREALAEEFKGRKLGGTGKVAEVDGAYFGGYVRPANLAEHRRDRRKLANQSGKASRLSSCASATAIRSRQSSSPKARRSHGSNPAFSPARWSMLTKRADGMICSPALK
ncbi:MAG TPA: hypothetical protein VMD53_01205 [Rhizomicrobium sp.]|nr:hypothetical protein [Rhizomicrobium sp.]